MNPDMLKSGGTTLLVIIGSVLSVLVATGKLTPDQSSALTTALTTAIPAAITAAVAIWKLLPHTEAAKAETIRTTPGLEVHVDTTPASPAPAALKAMANDNTVPNIIPQKAA